MEQTGSELPIPGGMKQNQWDHLSREQVTEVILKSGRIDATNSSAFVA